MQIVGIIVSIVVGILIIAISFYLYTIYCHPEDKGIGTAIGSKIVIILCQFLAWGQLLLIPLDVSNGLENGTSSMQALYSAVYIIIFVFTSFIIPFNIFLYQSDQQDSLLSRILWSALFSLGICGIWCMYVFISYIWLSKYQIDGVTYSVPIPLYMMLAMSLIGWVFLALNGGIGLIFLPYQLIKSFFIRPKQITKQQALQEKKNLQTKSQQLISMGEDIKKKFIELTEGDFNWFMKKKKQSQIKNELQKYKEEVEKLQSSFAIFDEHLGGIKPTKSQKDKDKKKDKNKDKDKDQAKDQEVDKEIQKTVKSNTRGPVYYCLSLFFGIIAACITIVWFIQLIGTTIVINNSPVFTFLDPPLLSLHQTPGVGFVSIAIYASLVLYLQGCTIQGNIVFGIRIPFVVSFHPMKKDRTFLNSFLFNVNLMMLSSISITQLAVLAFPTYLLQSYLGTFVYMIVFKLPLFGFLYQYRILMACLEGIFVIALGVMIFQIVRQCRKSKKSQ